MCEKDTKTVDTHINNLDGYLEYMHRKQIYTFYGGVCMLKGTYQTHTADSACERGGSGMRMKEKTCKKREFFVQIYMIVGYELESVIKLTNYK